MKSIFKTFMSIACLLLAILLCTSCGNTTQSPQYIYMPYEVEVFKEVEVPVEVPVEVIKEVETIVEVEKIVEVPIEVIKEVPVEIVKEVEVPVEVVKTEIKEVTKEVVTHKGYNITFADSPDFWNKITTKGTHFDYLAVYNCSDNTAGGCYDSYVLPCNETSNYYGPEEQNLIHYTQLPNRVRGTQTFLEYLNLSCFKRKPNTDYSKYLVNCTNRTSPGSYYDKNWEEADFGMGVYILKNVTVEGWHNTTTKYGLVNLSQAVITYEEAYAPCQLLQLTIEED